MKLKYKILSKEKLTVFIEDLLKEFVVFAPVKEDNYYRFKRISSSNEVQIEFDNSKVPPKEVFLPQTEVLFTFIRTQDGIEIQQSSFIDKPIVVFGVRPCDARALVLLDEFLSFGDHKDTYYLTKREKSIIIGMSCNNPRSTCFCLSVGGSPFSEEGMDLSFTDIGNKYLVKAISQKGENLVKRLSYLRDAEVGDREFYDKLARKVEGAITSKPPIEGLTEKLDNLFNSPVWDIIYQKCLGCGVCTYLCPTCWCFDILDEETSNGGRRIRIWDSCQYPLFTKQASGFNPRPSGKERMRQRIMHKFNYYPKNFDKIACVGCGRCVRACPVNLDIREVIDLIMRAD